MRRILLVLALVAAAPAPAQNVLSENPVLGSGGTTCAEFAAMDSVARQQALTAVEPAGGELPDADPTVARQWAHEVAVTCEGQPDRPLAEAAAQALGGD